jgi:mRNA interferase RelE/StbE
VVRLTDDAIADLRDLFKADPQIVRWAFKKMIHIEQDPNAGEPLLGGLIGYRKIAVGNRDWRLVWRVTESSAGAWIVEVAEVWAVGYRKDSEVYAEIAARVAAAGTSPKTTALTDVLKLFEKQTRELAATAEPIEPDPVPKWLSQVLTEVVGLRAEQVEGMTLSEAEAAWAAYTIGPGSAT